MKQQDDDDYSIIDKFYLYVKGSYKAKYQYLNKKRENNGLINVKAFIEYSNNMQDVFYKNVEEYNPSRKCNMLILLNDMIADIISNKIVSPIVIELFIITERKLKISTVFIAKFYFQTPKNVKLN